MASHPETLGWGKRRCREAADLSRAPKGEASASQYCTWVLAAERIAASHRLLHSTVCPRRGAGWSNPSGSRRTFSQSVSFYGALGRYGGVPGGSSGKDSACTAGDSSSIPGSGRSPGVGNGTHSSTFAWRIPWTEELVALYCPPGLKETEQLSVFSQGGEDEARCIS